MQCPACGVEVVEQAVYCHKCGERLAPSVGQSNGSPPAAEDAAAAFAQAVQTRRNASSPPEEELWRGGFSPKAMLSAWVLCGLISVALLIGGIIWARSFTAWLIVASLIFLPWLYQLAILAYRRMSVHYLLTTQRFLHESGLLRRVNNRIEVLDMDDISFEQGLLERLVGVGTIRIASTDRSDPLLELPGIEDVKNVAALFDNARIAERRRRGLHVEQI